MEQTLGHITHAKNLQQEIAGDPAVLPTWLPISFEAHDRWSKVPIIGSNWTLRASIRAREQVGAALRSSPLDGLFFHTSVTALCSWGLMGKLPTVVSMDSTPLDFDSIGTAYDHRPSTLRPLESLKTSLNRRTFSRARRLIVWCDWSRDSLIEDYGADPSKVVVIPPGVDMKKWRPAGDAASAGPVRLLFVGGDFRRKGGDTLLEAFRAALAPECELDIVTRERVDTGGLPGVRVHHGLGPNAPELMSLYARAHIFTFPTRADVLPLAIMEAMASGLPVITTSVGALREQVVNGVTGYLVPPGDARALAEATLSLARNSALRSRMSIAARLAAEQKFNAAINYARVLAVCKEAVDAG